jgi:hypothetical protein
MAALHVMRGGMTFDLSAVDGIELTVTDGKRNKSMKFTAVVPQQVALVLPEHPGDTRVVLVFDASDIKIEEDQ